MERMTTARLLLLTMLALAGLALGVYFMPKINPYFASRTEITRSQAAAIAEACLQRNNFDASSFFCDGIFVYDASGIEYLMGEFGVQPIMALGRADSLPLSFWQFDYYRNVPKDQQRETYQVRVSPAGKLISFYHFLPDSAAGDSLSNEAALQRAQAAVNNWPEIRASDFKLERSDRFEKPRRTDHKLTFARRDAATLKEATEVIEVSLSGAELSGVVRYVRDPQNFLTTSGVVSSANILLNTISVIVYLVLLFGSLVAFLRKYHEGEIGVRTGLWLAGLVFVALLLYAINGWDRMGVGVGFGAVSQLFSKFIHLGVSSAFGYNLIALMVLAGWTVGEQTLRTEAPRRLSGIDSVFNRKWLSKNAGRELPIGFAFGLVIFGLVQGIIFLLVKHLGVLPRLSVGSGALFDHSLPALSVMVNMLVAALFGEIVFRLLLISWLRRVLKSTGGAILVAAVLEGFFQIFFTDTPESVV